MAKKPTRAAVARSLRELAIIWRPHDANENAPAGTGAAEKENTDTQNDTPSKPETAQLHRALNLVVDSAIDADEALVRNDTGALSTAISALALNADAAQKLALSWRAS